MTVEIPDDLAASIAPGEDPSRAVLEARPLMPGITVIADASPLRYVVAIRRADQVTAEPLGAWLDQKAARVGADTYGVALVTSDAAPANGVSLPDP